jgi:FkbM family methyltransferase
MLLDIPIFIKKTLLPIFMVFKQYKSALNHIDQQLLQYFDFSDGFFVELGANDGIRQSNTLFLEKKKNWKGILIEPSQEKVRECKKNRPNSLVFCAACVPFNYNKKTVELIYADLMSIAPELASGSNQDHEAHVKRGQKFLSSKDDIYKFKAEAQQLNAILDKAKAPKKIDFLSIDVEGAEFSVLSGVDFNKYCFKFVLIETKEVEKIKKYLSKFQYSYVKHLSEHDILFSYSQ